MSLLVTLETLGLFINILTVKSSVRNSENLRQPIQLQESKKKQLFLIFLLYLWNLHEILKIFRKKMTLIAYIFPELEKGKDVVR